MMHPPTSEELMLLVDGELDPSRAAEVEAFLGTDDGARAIVAGLKLAGNLVAEDALDRASGHGDLVDEVMRKIESEPSRGKLVRLRSRRTAAFAVTSVLAAAAAFVLFVRTTGHGPGEIDARDEDSGKTAQVDEVDFGARTGTVFYVPSGAESTTAVVWLMDDEENAASGESL